MSKKPFDKSGASEVDKERRKFLKSSGAAIASGLAVPILAGSGSALAATESAENNAEEVRLTRAEVSSGASFNKPNIILIITDQERYPMHWPTGWADANLPNRARLAKHGLTFTQGFNASTCCTPSRGTLFTGLYPTEHGATQTHQYGTAIITTQPSLQPSIPNMATMLASAGYDVEYRGKWHLTKDPTGLAAPGATRDLELFGFNGWAPPDFGTSQSFSTLGGGTTDYDEWCATCSADFLKNRKSSKPFALIVSLCNPHDIFSFPGNPGSAWNQPSQSDMPPYKGTSNYANVDLDASPLDQIGLPPNFAQDPYRPAVIYEEIAGMNQLGVLNTNEDYLHYVRFYAYLHMVVDKHIGTVLDALKSRPSLYQNTVVIRVADHGEMGLSHGGMRQKGGNAYEEQINIPFVFSNPVLFPKPVQTSAMASTVDIMPTLATICGVPKKKIPTLRGADLTPIIRDASNHPKNPTVTVQDGVLFTTDELMSVFYGVISEPACVRCLRQERWKITMYYDPNGVQPSVYELFDLQNDPLEQNNLGNPSNPSYNASQLAIMQQALQAKMQEANAEPFTSVTAVLNGL